ncbi:MAG: ArsR family transcriptional regulator [Promethearchaeota archaeon]|nr:MAG: ArsR family transcriptional regulator [Candidatus Lokiarchaeota archaeon]
MNKNRESELVETLESCVNMQDIDVTEFFKDLQKLGVNLQGSSTFKQILDFASVIANEERLKIIFVLKDQDRCVCELEAILDRSQPTISHHLRELESLGLINSFKQGKFTHYKLEEERFNNYLELFHKAFGKLH